MSVIGYHVRRVIHREPVTTVHTGQQAEPAAFIRRLAARPAIRAAVLRVQSVLDEPVRDSLNQWLLKATHEADFELLSCLSGLRGLVLDLGANRGQAAISVLRRTRHLRVESWEPNPDMRGALALLRRLHPRRFRYRLCAAGERNETLTLKVPLGERDLSSQASLEPSEFDKGYVVERLRELGHVTGSFRELDVPVRRVDDCDFQPDLVKLDVEGWEAAALAGMDTLLTSARPALLIELNNSPAWAPSLAKRGYRFYVRDRNRLRRHSDWRTLPGLNVFCLHARSPSAVSQALLRLAPSNGK